jgi:copper chaperone CopZ
MTTAIFLIAFTFKVIGIDCAGCGPPIVRALSAVPGVKHAKVDTKTSMATVDVPGDFDKAKLRAAISNAGFEAEFPGETRTDIAPLPAEVVKTLDIVAFDGKTKVDIAKALAPGKVTVLDFYADWCGPCHVLEARLQRYMLAHPNVALRRIDIGKWNNAGARQATQFGAEALPYVRVYDAKGKLAGAVVGGMWDEVVEAVEKAGRR